MNDLAPRVGAGQDEVVRLNLLILEAESSKRPEDELLARREARKFFQAHPDAARESADLARRVERELIEAIPTAKYLGEAPQQFLDEMRKALGYEGAPALERLVIDRLLATWLRVQQAEMMLIAADHGNGPHRQPQQWSKRLSEASRNFLGAARTLALVRRKPMPSVIAQVNIAAPAQAATFPAVDRT